MSKHILKQHGSMDSLSAWSPSVSERSEYTLRKLTEAYGKQPPPVLVDRNQLDEALHRYEMSFWRLVNCGRPSSRNPLNVLQSSENVCPKREKKVKEDELKDRRSQKQLTDYGKILDKEYNILNKEFSVVKEEIMKKLLCGIGEQDIINRVQLHLKSVSQFFDRHLSSIELMDSRGSLRYKTLVLEHLKKLFMQNVSRFEKWLDFVVKMK